MVKRNPIADRVEQLTVHLGISVKDFSEVLGVQRSSLSHILSGRNKPSLDFILRILDKYPHVNEKWLLHGKGEIEKTDSSPTQTTEEPNAQTTDSVTNVNYPAGAENDNNVTSVTKKKKDPSLQYRELNSSKLCDAKKEIKQIVVLFSDGSFETYQPGKEKPHSSE